MSDDLRTLFLPRTRPSSHEVPDVELRRIDPSDRESLAKLYLASYPPEIGAADLSASLAEIDATFAAEYGVLRTDASLLVCLNRHAAGAILTVERSIWDVDVPGPFIIDLFVDPEFRGRGLGRALVTGVIDACSAAGDGTLSLRVGDGTSVAAHALYATLGFTSSR